MEYTHLAARHCTNFHPGRQVSAEKEVGSEHLLQGITKVTCSESHNSFWLLSRLSRTRKLFRARSPLRGSLFLHSILPGLVASNAAVLALNHILRWLTVWN